MLLNLLFLLLIVLHDFQPLSLHQTTFLNVELFLRLCKRRFIKSVVTMTKHKTDKAEELPLPLHQFPQLSHWPLAQ